MRLAIAKLTHAVRTGRWRENLPPTLLRAPTFFFIGIPILALFMFSVYCLTEPPKSFPVGHRVGIPLGASLAESAQILEREQVIRSSVLLQFLLIAQSGANGVQAGTYQFDQPLSVFAVARAVLNGTHGAPLRRVTIYEGLRNTEIDELLSSQFENVSPGEFTALTEGQEGYLLPETYHVPETFTAEQFVTLMEETFFERITTLEASFDASERSFEDIIIMASILEREASDEESMKLVAGILWKRLDVGMPLQVDASFSYLLDKTSAEVTKDDLRTDSPYNTYKHKGLPPTPLNNPGLIAIEAALSPTPSPYLYFLTAPNGTFHYARTLKEHVKNKNAYLD